MSTAPLVQLSSPDTMRINVDLPQPEGPITLMNSRLCTSNSMFLSAVMGACALSNTRPTPPTVITTGRWRTSSK
jgi:hypothetical protein